MPALNFKAQFAEMVADGRKRQTIRAMRKHPIKVGDKLFLYTGMRTRRCIKLGETECIEALPIEVRVDCQKGQYRAVVEFVGMKPLFFMPAKGVEEMARADGFKDQKEMAKFFYETHGRVTRGQLIRWKPTWLEEPGHKAVPAAKITTWNKGDIRRLKHHLYYLCMSSPEGANIHKQAADHFSQILEREVTEEEVGEVDRSFTLTPEVTEHGKRGRVAAAHDGRGFDASAAIGGAAADFAGGCGQQPGGVGAGTGAGAAERGAGAVAERRTADHGARSGDTGHQQIGGARVDVAGHPA